ncbi:MAG: SH3 domain-containing protein, partial [Clostridium perfringens]|nr:SH3 domain-containing protein [Clostridium perfringens]
MKRNKIISILEYSARNKMLVGILAVSLIGAGGVFLSSNAAISNNTMGINKTVLAGTLNNSGNKACVINGNDSLVLYTSASNSNIQAYISVGEMLTINSYSNGYYNVTVQETGATGYIASANMQKIVSGVGYDLTSLSGTAYTTNVSTVVNLREDATMNSTTLAKLKNNTSVTLLGKQGNWYKVSDNGTTGYIYGEYIAIANSN